MREGRHGVGMDAEGQHEWFTDAMAAWGRRDRSRNSGQDFEYDQVSLACKLKCIREDHKT